MKKNASEPSKHHTSLCQICRHPNRKEIDREFLHWTHPDELVREYGLGSSRAVYRHAHACGLFERRRERLRFALERIIEHASEIKPTPAVVLGAIRLAYQMDQKEQERGSAESSSPESGKGGRGRGYTPVEITMEEYPFFNDCFEPRPPRGLGTQTAHPAGASGSGSGPDRVSRDTGLRKPEIETTDGAAAAPPEAAAAAPTAGAPGTELAFRTGGGQEDERRRRDASATTGRAATAAGEGQAPAKVLWRSLAGRRERCARREHVIIPPGALGPDSGPASRPPP